MEQKRRESLLEMEEFLTQQFNRVRNVIEPESGAGVKQGVETQTYQSLINVATSIIRAQAEVANALENKGFV